MTFLCLYKAKVTPANGILAGGCSITVRGRSEITVGMWWVSHFARNNWVLWKISSCESSLWIYSSSSWCVPASVRWPGPWRSVWSLRLTQTALLQILRPSRGVQKERVNPFIPAGDQREGTHARCIHVTAGDSLVNMFWTFLLLRKMKPEPSWKS